MSGPNVPKAPTQQQQIRQLQEQLKQEQLERERDEKKSTAGINLNIFTREVSSRAAKWRMTARNIGSAYANAAKEYRKAFEHSDEENSLGAEIFFAVLTKLSLGTISWVWEAKALKEVRDLLGENLSEKV